MTNPFCQHDTIHRYERPVRENDPPRSVEASVPVFLCQYCKAVFVHSFSDAARLTPNRTTQACNEPVQREHAP